MENKKINIKENLKIYLDFLLKYKWIIFWILLFILIGEIIGLGEKFLFKILIDRGSEFYSDLISVEVFTTILKIIAIFFLVSVVVKSVARWMYLHLVTRLDSNLMKDLKEKVFTHIISLDYKFHTTHKTGSLISRMSRGGGAIETMSDVVLMNFSTTIIQLIVVTASIVYFDKISALVLVLVTIVFIGYSYILIKKQEGAKLEANQKEDFEKANLSDFMTNIDSIKYFGKEKSIAKKFGVFIEDTRQAQVKNWNYFRWFDSGQLFIIGVGTFFLILFPIIALLNKSITIGTLTFIYTSFASLAGSLFGFVWGIRGFNRSMADFQDLFEYMKVENEIKDERGADKLIIRRGEIEFKDVEFRYGKRDIFEKFNLKIPANSKVAFVGHSGCGKTTLIKLLYRLYDVDGGVIKIDGKDIRSFKQNSLRNEMSIVPQECVLFDDTIYNNVKFADESASREEILKAIKFAQLDKIIERFPNKEQTIVGERGVKLSGGEKQRVSIARAILANKKILVLDEATSALDSETEFEIQKDLKKLMDGRTSLIIAHRLSTIMHADLIVVMKDGKIIQTGTHFDLINQEGEYKKLWNLQKGGYIK